MKALDEKTDKAQWTGNTLQMECHYDYPTDHIKTYRMERVEIGGRGDTYWVAADGQCFAISSEDCCIAVLERALLVAGSKAVYVTFRRNAAGIKAWVKKWGKLTGANGGYHSFVTRAQ